MSTFTVAISGNTIEKLGKHYIGNIRVSDSLLNNKHRPG